jgi:hypothetical protein
VRPDSWVNYGRVQHARRLIEGRVIPVVVIAYAVFGALTLYRDNFLPSDKRARWETLALLPRWSISTWVAIALAIVALAFFEGSYRTDTHSRLQIDELQKSLAQQATAAWTDYGDDFLLNNGARLAPVAHIVEVRGLFDDLLINARNGDRRAVQRLLRACPKLDAVSLECYSSSTAHVEDTRRIQCAIEEFGERAHAIR